MTHMAILTDVTLCIGCEECVKGCKETNETGEDQRWRWLSRIDDLSASRWTTIEREGRHHYVRQLCRHCLDPACVSACPVAALYQEVEHGPVIYDAGICMGCRYCMMACPFSVPRYEWADPVPTVRKCILCYDKITSGERTQPACTEACPTEATIYGTRDELLAIAHQRIREQPDLYIDHVWGEHEVGGTNVLMISDIDLAGFGWLPSLDNQPIPDRTATIMTMVPPVFVGAGALMAGTWWIIERRMKLQGQKKGKKGGDKSRDDDDYNPFARS